MGSVDVAAVPVAAVPVAAVAVVVGDVVVGAAAVIAHYEVGRSPTSEDTSVAVEGTSIENNTSGCALECFFAAVIQCRRAAE